MPGKDCVIDEMNIRDYDEVAGLWRRSEGIGLHDSTDSRQGVAEYLRRNPGLSFVCRREGKLVGAVLCGHDGRRGYLHHLAVQHDRRRQGIARALVAKCLEKLGAIGIEKCNIFLFSNNKAGEEFWKHLGWKERADLKVLQISTNGTTSCKS
jgi:ribosomal protein S18 acetylase RimI-like enzyme